MKDKFGSESNDSKLRTLRIIGVIEPWAQGLEAEVRVMLASNRTPREPRRAVQPDRSGAFMLELDLTPELTRWLMAGGLELRAVRHGDERRVLGRQTLRGSGQHASMGVTLRIELDGLTKLFPLTHRASPELFPAGAVHALAGRVASMQGVPVSQARAPRGVVAAIRELNEIALSAAGTRAGDMSEETALRGALAAGALGSPGGASRGLGGALGAGVVRMLADALPGRGCGGVLDGAREIVETGFLLDLRDGNRTPVWTRQASALVRDRMRTVSAYSGSVDRALSEPGGRGDFPGGEPGTPPVFDDLTDPILPPGSPGDLPEPPHDLGGFGSDLCEMIAELCIGQFEATIAAALLDEYVCQDPIFWSSRYEST